MKKVMCLLLTMAVFVVSAANSAVDAYVVATGIVGDKPCSDAIQRLIDSNPNREIFFPDGTYLLDKPIVTPADPKKSVALRLSNYAHFKAIPNWTNTEAMVRLGGTCFANDIRTPGSCYSFSGGVIDGSGVAKGISIDSGRETKVQNVSMKNVVVGLHIKKGANAGSSDCDISDVNIVGNRKPGSIGVFVESHDNTFTNLRIADMEKGMVLTGGGNLLTNVHPLYTNPMDQYPESVGFDDRAHDNAYACCYSDHFSTAFKFAQHCNGTVLDRCIAWWYAPGKGSRHTAILCDGKFNARVCNLRIGFHGTEAENAVLVVAEPGGKGFLRDSHVSENRITSVRDASAEYSVRSRPLPIINPVIAVDWPDPSVWQGGDGWYYSVATMLKTMRRSRNLIEWEDMKKDPLTPEARSALWGQSGNVWAPNVVKIGDTWNMYISLFITDADCRIAVLSSDCPMGPFTYKGLVVEGTKIGILNTIDPYVFVDGGRVWMFCGSCQDGIHRIELAADGRTIKPGAKPVHVAGLRFRPDVKMNPSDRPTLLQELKWTEDRWPYFDGDKPAL